MKFIYFVLILFVLLFSCKIDSKLNEVKFEQLTTSLYKEIDLSSDGNKIGTKIFLVNVTENQLTYIYNSIDSFVCLYKPIPNEGYYAFLFDFYRKSANTNNEKIAQNPREFDRYSIEFDHICSYQWDFKSELFSKNIYNLKEYSIQTKDTFDCPNIW